MSRQAMLLFAVGAVLVLALYWMFLLSPKRDELAATQQAIQVAKDEQVNLDTQIDGLKVVRANAPEVEARLAATEALIPSGPALAPTLRQLQLAADEAGLVLTSVSPGSPQTVTLTGLPAGASAMSLSLSLTGSYFQFIDFLRRIEDPSITPRAIIWNSINVSPASYPTLSLSLSGTMFTLDRVVVAGEEEQ